MSDQAPSRFYVGFVTIWRYFWTYLAGALVLYALGLFVYQCYFWLLSGIWVKLPAYALWVQPLSGTTPLAIVPHITDPAWTPNLLIHGPRGDWIGFKRIILWLLDVHLALWAIVCAILCVPISLMVGPEVDVSN